MDTPLSNVWNQSFQTLENRVVLQTTTPSIISNGDEVILAGTNVNGQFMALACKNLSANWTSPLRHQGCVFAALVCFAVVSFLMFFLVLPILFGLICLFFAYKTKKHDRVLRRAREMIENA
jgi:hypothetical protein